MYYQLNIRIKKRRKIILNQVMLRNHKIQFNLRRMISNLKMRINQMKVLSAISINKLKKSINNYLKLAHMVTILHH